MPDRIVLGLFPGIGDAEDVRNRLHTEGIASRNIRMKVLRKVEPLPEIVLELEESTVDLFFGSALSDRYSEFIHNGETAVWVHIRSAEDHETAINTMRQYAPITIETIEADELAEILRREQSRRAGAPAPGS
jgi:hypothetical protein